MASSAVVILASALISSSVLIGCGGSGSGDDTGTTTTASTAPTTSTTTTTNNGECEAANFNRDWRPNADYKNNTESLAAKDLGACCQACQSDVKCVTWVFFAPESTCHVVLDDATWAGVLPATHYTFGAKKIGQCHLQGCSNCGHDAADVDDRDLKCAECDTPDSWNQYPCFLPQACKCGGDPTPWSTTTSPSTPSTGPTSGPSDMEDPFWDGEAQFV